MIGTCDRACARARARSWASASRDARTASMIGAARSGTGAAGCGTFPFLAFDFGAQRVGVACGNALTRGHAAAHGQRRGAEALRRHCFADRRVAARGAFVVGVPRHPDGASHGTRFARARPSALPASRALLLPVRGRRALLHRRGAGGRRARPRCGVGGDHSRAVPARGNWMSLLHLDAGALYADLRAGVHR